METTRTRMLTLGNAVFYPGANKGTEWTRHYGGTNFSYVSFSYLMNGQRVFINDGNDPTLNVRKSGMKLNIPYDPSIHTDDLCEVIAQAVAKEAMAIMEQSEIVISDAKDRSLEYSFCRIHVTHNDRFSGWSFPKAIIHRKYFE